MSTLFSGHQNILIEGKLIIAVGEEATLEPHDELFELGNHFLSPAFGDGHAHPLFAGREAQGPQITGLESLDQIIAKVKAFAENNPELPWIIGGAYDSSLVAGGDFDAHWLDAVISNRPVVLHAIDHHSIWVNSKALEICGITLKIKDPKGGRIKRRADGSPKGVLHEPEAIRLVLSHAPKRTLKQDVAAIKYACNKFLDSGVTLATDSWIESGMAEAYIQAFMDGELTVDMNLAFLASPEKWESEIIKYLSLRSEISELNTPLLKASAVKFLCDGALSSGTAALLEPYLDDPTSSGISIWSDSDLTEAALAFDRHQFQLHLHAIGDAAVRQALDVIEEISNCNPPWDRRPVIVHAQLIHKKDAPRFAALGVIANFQPLWTYLDPMNEKLILPRIGEVRNNRQFQIRTLRELGVRISFGSDWPVTSEIPLRGLAVPVHRQNPDGLPIDGWSKEEAITIQEALSFYTEAVGYQTFREKSFGKLEVGMNADFIILSSNPAEVDPQKVRDIEIIAVYKNGERVR